MGVDDKDPVYRLMKDALPEIECPYEQPRIENFSDGFWERYETMTSEVRVHEVARTEGSQSLASRVRPILMETVANGVHRGFAQRLLGDLQNRGTLPDHVLREIFRQGRRGRTALETYLSALEQSLGDRIAVAVPDCGDDGVIVSIDHAAEV